MCCDINRYAELAAQAVHEHAVNLNGSADLADLYGNLIDLLVGLRHLAAVEEFDWDALLNSVRLHYSIEARD